MDIKTEPFLVLANWTSCGLPGIFRTVYSSLVYGYAPESEDTHEDGKKGFKSDLFLVLAKCKQRGTTGVL